MQCPQCQREAIEGAVFCNHCGAQLQHRCRRCNTLNPLNSSYCHNCGTEIGSESETEEHTPVSHRGLPSTTSPVPTCPRCHTTNEPGSQYCFHCGLPLEGSTTGTTIPFSVGVATYQGTPAGFWVRVVAYVIDGIVLSVVVGILAAVVFGENYFTEEDLTAGDVLGYLLNAAYFTVAVAVWGTTIGKRVFGMYVIRTNGSKVSIGRALARYVMYIVSALPFLLGFIMIGLRRDKRGLHDLICDTRVVKR